jgi:hypothetical protein
MQRFHGRTFLGTVNWFQLFPTPTFSTTPLPPVLEILCKHVPLLKFVSTQTLNLDTEKGHDLPVYPSQTVSSEGFTPKNWEQTGNRLGTNSVKHP